MQSSVRTVAVTALVFACLLALYLQCTFFSFQTNVNSDIGRELHDSLPTNDEVRYLLSGDKPQSAQRDFNMFDPFLLRHIRAHVSRPTPGRPPRLPARIDQSDGNFNGVERLPGDVSQSCQSTFIDRLLGGRRNGVFLECGAFDGITLSNSWFFETQRNWTGLLVEGNPQLQRSVIIMNRNALLLRACLSPVTRPMSARMTLAGGLSRLVDHRNSGSTAEVVCFPLSAVAAALDITHIDFMPLDVEGTELEILNTIDWARLRIDVIMLEYGASVDKLLQLRRFANATGLYREVANLKSRQGPGLDVVFQRLDLKTN